MKRVKERLAAWPILVIGLICFLIIDRCGNKTKIETPLSRNDSIQAQFNYDGSHKAVIEALLKYADEKGYAIEPIKTGYNDLGEILIITTEYKETDTNGKVSTKVINAEVDMSGKILKMHLPH